MPGASRPESPVSAIPPWAKIPASAHWYRNSLLGGPGHRICADRRTRTAHSVIGGSGFGKSNPAIPTSLRLSTRSRRSSMCSIRAGRPRSTRSIRRAITDPFDGEQEVVFARTQRKCAVHCERSGSVCVQPYKFSPPRRTGHTTKVHSATTVLRTCFDIEARRKGRVAHSRFEYWRRADC